MAMTAPLAKRIVPVKKMMPRLLISELFKLLTIFTKIKHGIMAVTIISEISLHVGTDNTLRLAMK